MKKETKKIINKKTIVDTLPKVKIEKKEECCCSSKKKKFLPVVIFLVLVICGVLYYKFANVATVNGKPISRIKYIKLLEKQDNKNILNQMIQESLINEQALKNNVKIEKSEIDASIATIETSVKAQGQTLEEALTANGMTRSDLDEQIRMKLIVEKLSDPKTEITQAQIDDFLTKNKASLPVGMAKDKLQDLAKEQLISQAKNEAVNAWLGKLTEEAKIVYK